MRRASRRKSEKSIHQINGLSNELQFLSLLLPQLHWTCVSYQAAFMYACDRFTLVKGFVINLFLRSFFFFILYSSFYTIAYFRQLRNTNGKPKIKLTWRLSIFSNYAPLTKGINQSTTSKTYHRCGKRGWI